MSLYRNCIFINVKINKYCYKKMKIKRINIVIFDILYSNNSFKTALNIKK